MSPRDAVVDGPQAGSDGPSRWAGQFAPIDLDRVPAVDGVLQRLGLGPFVRSELAPAPVGRNQMWAGPTESGRRVFVKHLIGPAWSVDQRISRVLHFERTRAVMRDEVLRTPRIIGTDVAEGLIVFEYLEGARAGNELALDQAFDDGLAHAAGTLIGALHDTMPDNVEELDRAPPDLPSPELLVGLPVRLFEQASFGELQTWRLLQQDQPLIDAVRRLQALEQAAPRVPSHCDLRLDQLLITDEGLFITDWEEFRLADPARDVGSFAGEWLSRAILDIVAESRDSAVPDEALTHDAVIQRGVTNLDKLRSRVTSFWRGYVESRSMIDEGLVERATAFAGWHLIDRLIASAAQNTRLSAIQRAAAGVGRTALMSPSKFSGAIGLALEVSGEH